MTEVVVTGVGMVTPLGNGWRLNWGGLIDRLTGVKPCIEAERAGMHDGVAGIATPPIDVVPKRLARLMTRSDYLGVIAAQEALSDAGLIPPISDAGQAGIFAASTKDACDPAHLSAAVHAARRGDGTYDVSEFVGTAREAIPPLLFVEGLPCAILFYLSVLYGLEGPNVFLAGMADAGINAIGQAFRTVRRGETPWALAGGCDELSWWTLSRLVPLGVVAAAGTRGADACAPFTQRRQGMVPGEGAVFLVLEDWKHAIERGGQAYARVCGYGRGSDSSHAIAPDQEGDGLVVAIRRAMTDAAVTEVDAVIAHGSGTRRGDAAEVRAWSRVWPDPASRPLATAVKPATGHMLAASGAFNAAVAALSVAKGAIPPLRSTSPLDPECAWNFALESEPLGPRRHVLALGRGLQGEASALVLGRPPAAPAGT